MEDILIVKEFSERIRKAFPGARVYFYGSRAVGSHSMDSDFDVLVALDAINPATRNRVYDIAWETGFQYDAVIAPVLAEKNEMTRHSSSPFYKNVTGLGRIV